MLPVAMRSKKDANEKIGPRPGRLRAAPRNSDISLESGSRLMQTARFGQPVRALMRLHPSPTLPKYRNRNSSTCPQKVSLVKLSTHAAGCSPKRADFLLHDRMMLRGLSFSQSTLRKNRSTDA